MIQAHHQIKNGGIPMKRILTTLCALAFRFLRRPYRTYVLENRSGWLLFFVYFAVFLGREVIPWGALISLWPCCVLAAAVLLALSVVSLFRLSISS